MSGVTPFCSMQVIALAGIVAFAPIPAQGADGDRSTRQAAYQLAQLGYTDVLVMLERTGYHVVKMDSTLLGRVRILARNREHLREVIVSRSTGEIKRDVILKRFATNNDDAQALPVGQHGNVSAGASTGNGTTGGTVTTNAGNVSVGVSTGGVSVDAGGVSAGVSTGGLGLGN